MTDGSRLELTHISFAMDDDDGGVFEDRPTLTMELYPTWGDRAIEYTTKAANHHDELIIADLDSPEQMQALVMEMVASMEACAAVGFALDALYAGISGRVSTEDGTREAWERNGTARASQVGHMIRRGFRISNQSGQELDRFLGTAYRFRDWAVHPSADFRQARRHPDLDHGIEWRFVAFRYEHAYVLTKNLLATFSWLPDLAREDNEAIVTWAGGLRIKSEELETKMWAKGLPDPSEYL